MISNSKYLSYIEQYYILKEISIIQLKKNCKFIFTIIKFSLLDYIGDAWSMVLFIIHLQLQFLLGAVSLYWLKNDIYQYQN